MPQRTSKKVCSKCGERKLLTEFAKHRNRWGGIQPYCKPCGRAVCAKWREAHPGYQKAKTAAWRKANPDRVKARNDITNRKRDVQYQIETYGRPVEIHEMTKDRFRAARALGFRSGLEVRIAKELDAIGIKYRYEEETLTYTVPSEEHRYTPDFVLPNGIMIEAKGEFDSADRKKIKFVLEQHPGIDLRIVFSNANGKIGKKSKTTYAIWCTRLGIKYAAKSIPLEWINEPPKPVAA